MELHDVALLARMDRFEGLPSADVDLARLALLGDARIDAHAAPALLAAAGALQEVVVGSIPGSTYAFDVTARGDAAWIDVDLRLRVDDVLRFDRVVRVAEGRLTVLQEGGLVLLVRAVAIEGREDVDACELALERARERYARRWARRSARARERALDAWLEAAKAPRGW